MNMKATVLIAAALFVGIGLPINANAYDHGSGHGGHSGHWSSGYGYRGGHGYYHRGYGYGYGYGPYFGYSPVYPVVVGGGYYSQRVYEGREVYHRDSVGADVQVALRKRGYYSGAIDGDIGPGTRSAIRRYQRDHDLRATGAINDSLLDRLGL